MKSQLEITIEPITLPEVIYGLIPRERPPTAPSAVTQAPSAVTQAPPAPPPTPPAPVRNINLVPGNLSSEQIEWLIDNFAERLRIRAGVHRPPITIAGPEVGYKEEDIVTKAIFAFETSTPSSMGVDAKLRTADSLGRYFAERIMSLEKRYTSRDGDFIRLWEPTRKLVNKGIKADLDAYYNNTSSFLEMFNIDSGDERTYPNLVSYIKNEFKVKKLIINMEYWIQLNIM